jgi:hypothetical protein
MMSDPLSIPRLTSTQPDFAIFFYEFLFHLSGIKDTSPANTQPGFNHSVAKVEGISLGQVEGVIH